MFVLQMELTSVLPSETEMWAEYVNGILEK